MTAGSEREGLLYEQLAQLVRVRFDESDQQSLKLLRAESGKAIRAARSGQDQLAGECFAHSDRMLDELPFSLPARRFAEAVLFARKAYHLYRQQDFDGAVDLVRRAFENDLFLETQHGFDILLVHRMQLLHNRMRVEIRRENWSLAQKIGAALLAYVERPQGSSLAGLSDPWCRNWGDYRRFIWPSLAAKIHAQIAVEAGTLQRMEGARPPAAGER